MNIRSKGIDCNVVLGILCRLLFAAIVCEALITAVICWEVYADVNKGKEWLLQHRAQFERARKENDNKQTEFTCGSHN